MKTLLLFFHFLLFNAFSSENSIVEIRNNSNSLIFPFVHIQTEYDTWEHDKVRIKAGETFSYFEKDFFKHPIPNSQKDLIIKPYRDQLFNSQLYIMIAICDKDIFIEYTPGQTFLYIHQ